MEKPVLFLDIDGVLNGWSGNKEDMHPKWPSIMCRVPGAGEFFLWAREHFDIRWLTAWRVNTEEPLRDWSPRAFDQIAQMEWLLGLDREHFIDVRSAKWWNDKFEGVVAVIGESDRDWVWLEDGVCDADSRWLTETNNWHRFINVDCVEDFHALEKAHVELIARRNEHLGKES